MSVIKHVTAPVTFCAQESQRFWEIKGKTWWSCSKAFSTLAYKAILEDAFGGQEHIETFCFDIQEDKRLMDKDPQTIRPMVASD
jgi:hypothetical protein